MLKTNFLLKLVITGPLKLDIIRFLNQTEQNLMTRKAVHHFLPTKFSFLITGDVIQNFFTFRNYTLMNSMAMVLKPEI